MGFKKQQKKIYSYEYQPPQKILKRTLFIKSKKALKMHQKHFLFIIQMFSNVIDLLNYDAVKKIFFEF